MAETYNPQESEKKWLAFWEKEAIYKFHPKTKKPIFSIDFPPPTVSGKMHIGHSFSYSQEDFIARYKRMKGYEVFMPYGTDDNGLATERLVERLKNVKSKKMDRKEFVALCLKTLEEIRPDFVADWKHLGVSCDYSLFYSTINEHCQKVSQKSFIDLYKKGLEYRKFAPLIFCPECKTVIAQVEMEDREEKSTLNFIRAKIDDGAYLIYATTRPELLYGCVGMSINENGMYVKYLVNGATYIVSKDSLEKIGAWLQGMVKEEFLGRKLIGKKVTIPISGNVVPITHDVATETRYGTGLVYYCTYGGLDCVQWMARHPGVEPIHVMGMDGRYNDKCGKYAGLTSPEARKQVLEDLEKEEVLLRIQPITHIVNVHERCGTPIEYVATEQWFIRYLDKKDILQKAADSLRWHPAHMKNRYDNWIKGLQWDWCISRQRYFGVPIPVWYCAKCHAVLLPEEKQLPVDPLTDKPPHACPKCRSAEYVPEKDVLDTWATSSLTPKIAASLVPEMYDKLYPMSFRQNSHDIITFWLFNTVVKSQLENNLNPWEDVMITGWVLDPKGKKMSKSKGNVIDPRDVWGKYSVDAVRFAAAGTKLGDDYPFQEKDVITGQKTVTKLWNAAKFSSAHLSGLVGKPAKLEAFDRWILSKLQHLIQSNTENFDSFEYSRVKADTEKFFWLIFCDIYLEVVKDRLYNPDVRGLEGRASAQYALYSAFLSVLKSFAPIMPYITEELYDSYFRRTEGVPSMHVSSWPVADSALVDAKAELIGDQLLDVISAVRKAKSEKGVSLKEPVKELILHLKEHDVAPFIDDLKAVTKAERISFGKSFAVVL